MLVNIKLKKFWILIYKSYKAKGKMISISTIEPGFSESLDIWHQSKFLFHQVMTIAYELDTLNLWTTLSKIQALWFDKKWQQILT